MYTLYVCLYEHRIKAAGHREPDSHHPLVPRVAPRQLVPHARVRRYMPYMYALCVCLIRMPYVYALYVCLICMPYMVALHVCLTCMPYMMPSMHALHVCLTCILT